MNNKGKAKNGVPGLVLSFNLRTTQSKYHRDGRPCGLWRGRVPTGVDKETLGGNEYLTVADEVSGSVNNFV